MLVGRARNRQCCGHREYCVSEAPHFSYLKLKHRAAIGRRLEFILNHILGVFAAAAPGNEGVPPSSRPGRPRSQAYSMQVGGLARHLPGVAGEAHFLPWPARSAVTTPWSGSMSPDVCQVPACKRVVLRLSAILAGNAVSARLSGRCIFLTCCGWRWSR